MVCPPSNFFSLSVEYLPLSAMLRTVQPVAGSWSNYCKGQNYTDKTISYSEKTTSSENNCFLCSVPFFMQPTKSTMENSVILHPLTTERNIINYKAWYCVNLAQWGASPFSTGFSLLPLPSIFFVMGQKSPDKSDMTLKHTTGQHKDLLWNTTCPCQSSCLHFYYGISPNNEWHPWSLQSSKTLIFFY